MRKVLAISLAALGLVLASGPAQAGGKHHGGHHYAAKSHHAHLAHHHRHGYKHKHRKHRHHHAKRHHKHYGKYHHKHRKYDDIDDEILIGAAIIGGAIVAHGVITKPDEPKSSRHHTSQHAPFCERTDVYRNLPDGRIQWGVRTVCY